MRDLASSLLQAAEITIAVMIDPASGVEALSLAAAELRALPDGQLAVDVLMETPDLRNTDIPPAWRPPTCPTVPCCWPARWKTSSPRSWPVSDGPDRGPG